MKVKSIFKNLKITQSSKIFGGIDGEGIKTKYEDPKCGDVCKMDANGGWYDEDTCGITGAPSSGN